MEKYSLSPILPHNHTFLKSILLLHQSGYLSYSTSSFSIYGKSLTQIFKDSSKLPEAAKTSYLPRSTFSLGTTTSTIEKPAVLEQRCPMFISFRPLVKPGLSPSTMKPVKALEAGVLGSELQNTIQSNNSFMVLKELLLFTKLMLQNVTASQGT